jgi:hypothetical protein
LPAGVPVRPVVHLKLSSILNYNPLPDILVNDIWIDFSPKDRLLYDKMERDFLIEIEDTTVELVNHMSLMVIIFS